MAGGGHSFTVEVLTPEGEVYRGEIVQLSTRTVVGEIGILANHAPVLALLEPTELRLYESENEIRRYAQSHGMMQVYGNHAQVLVEEAIPAGELDAATLREELDDARQRMEEAEDGSAAHSRAQQDHERTEKFISLAEAL